VRPRGKAIRKPRHSIPTGWVDDKPVAKRAHAPVKPEPSLRACGARPSVGRPAHYGWPRGEDLGTTLKAVFSEGRTPCVRLVRPYVHRSIASFRSHNSSKTRLVLDTTPVAPYR